MRIVVHVNKYYDWVPVPSDVQVADTDVRSGLVKPASGGGWSMRVTKEAVSHTTVCIPEAQVIAKIIHEKTRPEGGRTFTRRQAVAHYLAEQVMPHHAHRDWITDFEIHDDGPDEAMCRSMVQTHVDAKNIHQNDLELHVASYIEAADHTAHTAHLRSHFKVEAK